MDVEEFIDNGIVELAVSAKTRNATSAFNTTFDLLEQAYSENALRRFIGGQPAGRVSLAAFECIAIGVAKNITNIKAKPDPVQYLHKRIAAFWQTPEINQFFVAGLRGTVRIQRPIPFGTRWFSR